jgi:hypothetical protein
MDNVQLINNVKRNLNRFIALLIPNILDQVWYFTHSF